MGVAILSQLETVAKHSCEQAEGRQTVRRYADACREDPPDSKGPLEGSHILLLPAQRVPVGLVAPSGLGESLRKLAPVHGWEEGTAMLSKSLVAATLLPVTHDMMALCIGLYVRKPRLLPTDQVLQGCKPLGMYVWSHRDVAVVRFGCDQCQRLLVFVGM